MKHALKKSAEATGRVAFTITERLLSTMLERRALQTSIDRPIIVVGPERSGTSFVYAMLANHPDIYALTTIANRFPDYPFSASLIRRTLSLGTSQNYRSMPKTICGIEGGLFPPTEAVRYWFRHLGSHKGGWISAADDFLTEDDLDDATRKTLPEDLKKRLFIMQKKRLLLKQPGFSLKIRYLNSLFPDAIFVHCLRNPFDNFFSLMNQKKKSGNLDWGIRIPEHMRLRGASVEAQAAQQLAATYDLILQNIERIENMAGRYITVRYEAFESDFAQETQKLFRNCGLEAPSAILRHPEIFESSNLRKRTFGSVTDDRQALSILERLEQQMGYNDLSKAKCHSTIA